MGSKFNSDELRISGTNMAQVILARINSLGLNTSELIAQNYDGAASISSQRVGITAHIKEVSPLAFYFHYTAHALNLATLQVNRVDVVKNALGTMESIIISISNGAKREFLLRSVQNENDSIQRKLKKLCQTRFIERHVAVQRFCDQLSAISSALLLMTKWNDRKLSSNASNFRFSLKKKLFSHRNNNNEKDCINLTTSPNAASEQMC